MKKRQNRCSKRVKIYTKFSKQIIVAVREGGPDPDVNYKLKDIIDKAQEANMPNDNMRGQ